MSTYVNTHFKSNLEVTTKMREVFDLHSGFWNQPHAHIYYGVCENPELFNAYRTANFKRYFDVLTAIGDLNDNILIYFVDLHLYAVTDVGVFHSFIKNIRRTHSQRVNLRQILPFNRMQKPVINTGSEDLQNIHTALRVATHQKLNADVTVDVSVGQFTIEKLANDYSCALVMVAQVKNLIEDKTIQNALHITPLHSLNYATVYINNVFQTDIREFLTSFKHTLFAPVAETIDYVTEPVLIGSDSNAKAIARETKQVVKWIYDNPPEDDCLREYYNRYRSQVANAVITKRFNYIVEKCGYSRKKVKRGIAWR